MAIKRPSISKPGIVKPNTGMKKPSGITKPVVEEPKVVVVEEPKVQVEEEPVQVVQEEPIIEEEIEVPADIVVEEVKAVEEVENVEKKLQEKPEEEEKAEVIEEPEPVVEEKPKKKSSRKKTAKKEEKVEPKEEPVEVKEYKAKPLADAMKDMVGITGCTTPEWEQTKKTITEQVESMHIDPDSTPAEMRYLIADIDAALSQLKIYKINADQQFNPLLKHINYVSLQAGSKGANSEERKANAIRGLIEYKSNPDDMEYTNLLDIQVYAENQLAFYDEMIKILMDKKNMLITFSGIVKTESQLGSY
jgi:hypothetical protein